MNNGELFQCWCKTKPHPIVWTFSIDLYTRFTSFYNKIYRYWIDYAWSKYNDLFHSGRSEYFPIDLIHHDYKLWKHSWPHNRPIRFCHARWFQIRGQGHKGISEEECKSVLELHKWRGRSVHIMGLIHKGIKGTLNFHKFIIKVITLIQFGKLNLKFNSFLYFLQLGILGN